MISQTADLELDGAQEELCDLLLEVACKDTNRLAYVRRHVRVLRAAMPYMNTAQAQIADQRIDRLRTKWGQVLLDGENEPQELRFPPETLVVNWLAQRRFPEAHLKMMVLAAEAVWQGTTGLDAIKAAAYPAHPRAWFHLPGYDSFREWLFLLRIARPDGPGVYRPGILCKWWVDEMQPTKDKGAAYTECLKQLTLRKRLSWERRVRSGKA